MSEQEVKEFSGRVIGLINGASLTLSITIGHQTGLFDTMAEFKEQPKTSAEIAAAAKLNERYVREWLGAVVVGDIVRIVTDKDNVDRYVFPAAHAAVLTRAAGLKNLCPFAQIMPFMCEVREEILNCFRNGGGLTYPHYKPFHAAMASISDARNQAILLPKFVPSVPGLAERLSKGIKTLDIGCGRGAAVRILAAQFPKSECWGYDFSADTVEFAQKAAADINVKNAHYKAYDCANLPQDKAVEGYFDYITAFDAIHDMSYPHKALDGIYKALKPGGYFSMVDINAHTHHAANKGHPLGPTMYTISYMHCMSVSLSCHDGVGLGNMWGQEKAVDMLKHAGFKHVEIISTPDDILNVHYLCRKD